MSASGVPDNDDPGEIERVLTRDGPDVVDGPSDIDVSAGPPAARFSEPPVFDVPRRNPSALRASLIAPSTCAVA